MLVAYRRGGNERNTREISFPYVDIVGVTGSIPVTPTIQINWLGYSIGLATDRQVAGGFGELKPAQNQMAPALKRTLSHICPRSRRRTC